MDRLKQWTEPSLVCCRLFLKLTRPIGRITWTNSSMPTIAPCTSRQDIHHSPCCSGGVLVSRLTFFYYLKSESGLAAMSSMFPNAKQSCNKFIPVHPNQSLTVLLRARRFTTHEWSLSIGDIWHSRQPSLRETDWRLSNWRCKPVAKYPCTGGPLVNQCSVIQQPAVSYPLMLPVMAPLLFWNANPVMPYMYPGGVTYQPHYCWPVGVPHLIPDTKYFVASFSCLRTLI